MEEYLTIAEIATRLKLSPKTIRNKMASGELVRGVHYFKRKGMTPRFKWSKVQVWLEETDESTQEVAAIPLKRGSLLRIPLTAEARRTIQRANGL